MTNTLYIKAYGQYVYDSSNLEMAAYIFFNASSTYTTPSIAPTVIEFTSGTEDPSATPYPRFNTIESAIVYLTPTKAPALMTVVNTGIGSSYYTAYDVEAIEAPILNAITHLSYNNLLDKPTLFDGDYTHLTNRPSIPSFTAGSHILDGATNAAINASTTQVTSYNTLSGLLGIATGLNDANTAQNDLATKYNAAAGKLNDLATKFNTLLDRLEANGLLATS